MEQKAAIERRTGQPIMRPGTEYRWRDKDGREHTLLPDAGWSYNPGRQPLGPPVISDPKSPQRDSPAAKQKTWEWFGRPKALTERPLPDSPAPIPGQEVEHVLKLLGATPPASCSTACPRRWERSC